MNFLKKTLLYLAGLTGLLLLFFAFGPRVDTRVNVQEITLPDDLNQYLSAQEQRFNNITPGTEKTIFWANDDQSRTEYSIVYLHGFSATWQETAPLAERLGERLNANVFNTRFTGHGRDGQAMTEASLNAWLNDVHEAMRIAEQLGEKTIVLGVSTGGTAATWAALQNYDSLSALILVSPNFGPKDGRSMILTWPLGEQIAKAMIGPERSWTPQNEAHAKYWTYRYPTEAILPMMALVKEVQGLPIDEIQIPSLWIYSEKDTVLNVDAMNTAFARFGSEPKQRILVNDSENPDHHVLTGDILAPSTLPRMIEDISAFIRTLP